MIQYNTRKHFEAALHDLADLFGVKRAALRNTFKWYLIRNDYIKESTTELSDKELLKMAQKIQKFKTKMENTPPRERGIIDILTILSYEISSHLPHLLPKSNSLHPQPKPTNG